MRKDILVLLVVRIISVRWRGNFSGLSRLLRVALPWTCREKKNTRFQSEEFPIVCEPTGLSSPSSEHCDNIRCRSPSTKQIFLFRTHFWNRGSRLIQLFSSPRASRTVLNRAGCPTFESKNELLRWDVHKLRGDKLINIWMSSSSALTAKNRRVFQIIDVQHAYVMMKWMLEPTVFKILELLDRTFHSLSAWRTWWHKLLRCIVLTLRWNRMFEPSVFI